MEINQPWQCTFPPHISLYLSESGFWGLINNAERTSPIGPTEWMQLEDFRKVLDVNLIGLIEVTLKFLPLLKKAQGSVVNVASIPGGGFPSMEETTVYPSMV